MDDDENEFQTEVRDDGKNVTFDPRFLLMLLTVAEAGSINRAAQFLNVSQPALSKNFRDVEARIGVSLLERSRSGTELTEIGKALCQNARAIRAELNRAQRQFDGMQTASTGTITIGTGLIGERYLIPPAMNLFLSRQQNCRVNIFEDSVKNQVFALRQGEIDLVIGLLWQEALSRDDDVFGKGLLQEVLFEISVTVVVCADHPLTRKQNLKLEDTSEYTWLLPTKEFQLRDMIENAFHQGNFEPIGNTVECPPNSIARNLVRRSDMIAPLPRQSVEWDLKSGSLAEIDLDLQIPVRPAGIICIANNYQPPELRSFVDCLRQTATELIPN